ncbi:MAG TPA: tetratricopeptide repeat protein, partial [Oscillatoriales cyanobacterium M59_W2019_021]|nr:tetratricopeptide repeat protein [Oscillatoriales cyanobacterium M59_W2019_021]
MQLDCRQSETAKAYVKQGIVQQEKGQLEAAVSSYREALRYCGGREDATLDRLLIYNNLGCALTSLGKYDEAMAAYLEVSRIDPDYPPLYNNLGQFWLRQGELDRAISAYRRSLQLDPQRVLTAYNLGKALQKQGRHAEAVACFQKVLQLKPDGVQIFDECGLEFLEAGKFSEAAIYLQAAISRQPDWVEAYCQNMAQLVPSNDLDRARAASGQLLRSLQKQDIRGFERYLVEIYTHLGRVYFQSGLYDRALQTYQKAGASKIPQLQPDWQACQLQQQRVQHLIAGGKVPAALPQGVYLSARGWGDRSSTDRPLPPNSTYPLCEGLHCHPCWQRIAEGWGLTEIEAGIYTYENSQPREELPPDLFTVTIPEGRAWIMPQENWWRVCEAVAIVTPDNYLLGDVSREYPGQLPGCQKCDPTRHRIFRQESLPPLERLEGTVAVIAGLSANVYFHWMVDILPRLEILRREGWKWEQIDRFVVNQCRQPFQKETLKRLGIPESKIIESDRHPHVRADRLIVPSFPGDLGMPSPWVLDFLRQTFLPETSLAKPSADRIYISRSKAGYRRLLGEAEVISCLQGFGFVSVALEELSLDEQIHLFRNAKTIVGAHGSGFTNIIFCQPGTQIVEFVSPHYFRHYFGAISQQLGLQHYYLVGRSFRCDPLRHLMYINPLIEDLAIDLDALQKILEKLGIVKSGIPMTQTTVPPRQRENIMPPLVHPEQTADHYQQRAEALLAQGKPDDAIAACQEALRSDPRSAATCKTLGNIWRAKKDLQQARNWYLKAIEFNPNYAEAYANLGNLAAGQQDWKLAIAYFQKAIALKPDFAGAYQHLSKVWQKIGRELESTDCLYRAYELEPQGVKPEALVNLGNRLFKQDRLTHAIDCYQKALKLDPTISGAYHNLAEALTRQGRLQEANALYRQASRLSVAPPGSSSTGIAAVDRLSAEVSPPRPIESFATPTEIVAPQELPSPLGSDTADRFLDRVRQTQQEIENAYQQLGAALKRQEELHREALRFREAVLQLALGKQPSIPAFQNGTALHSVRETTALQHVKSTSLKNLFDGTWSSIDLGVESSISMAVVSSGANSVANHRLSDEELDRLDGSRSEANDPIDRARQACASGNFPEAIALCQQVLREQPQSAVAYAVMGDALQGAGKMADAEKSYKRAISLQPEEVGAYVSLGDLYIRQEQWKLAILVFQKAMKLDPLVAEPHERLGDILKVHDRLDGAIRYYRAALDLAPETWTIYHKLGDVFQAQGRIDEAIDAYQRATEL